MEKRDMIALTTLFLVYLYLFTLPLQETSVPFGEGDATHKFGLVDYMVINDIVPKKMPFFYASWYAYLTPTDFYAPPNTIPFFIAPATIQTLGGQDRFSGINFYFALIAGFTVILAVYFLGRKLFGFWIAVVAGMFLLIPGKTLRAYMWGQRPHHLALSFVPLAIYCLYKYLDGYSRGEEKKLYLMLYGAFVGLGAVFHLQSLIPIGIFTIVYSSYIMIKRRKFPYSLKSVGFCIVIILLILGPHLGGLLGQQHLKEELGSGVTIQNVGNLFSWFKTPLDFPNRDMYSYSSSNGGLWSLPFLLVGLLILGIRRKKADLVTLFFLIAVYIGFHLDVFNLLSQGRITRIIYIDSQIFALLIGVGVIGLPSLIGLKKEMKNYARIGLVVLFAILLFNFSLKPGAAILESAYPPIERITPAQYEAAEWLRANTPEDAVVWARGQITYPKQKWMHMFSHRSIKGYYEDTLDRFKVHVSEWPERNTPSHALFDYSDYVAINNKDAVAALQLVEQQLENETLVYDKNNIRVYEIGN